MPVKTCFGFLCGFAYVDFDGSHETAEWVEPASHEGEPDTCRQSDEPGWFAECAVEPEAGWIGPFATEAEAILVASDEAAFQTYMHADEGRAA